MVDQEKLNKYFSGTWIKTRRNTSLISFELTGASLIDKIKPGESVIDVGCGNNPFKGKIPNLIGVDPAFDEADFKCTIDEFETDQKFDVAFCLGSINFGSTEDIMRQIKKVISLLKPNGRIYWRCNPGAADHNNEECKDIPFYNWSLEKHVRFSEIFNCRLEECRWDTNNRLYAEWIRR
jgi:cyclopropane fatty-acyl-phospholipid synthase-like methyltransferase